MRGALDAAIAQIDRIFGNQTQDVSPKEVRQLRATLEKTLGPRESWPLPLLRGVAIRMRRFFCGIHCRAKIWKS